MNSIVDNILSLPDNLLFMIKLCSCFESGFTKESIKQITNSEEKELQFSLDNLLHLHLVSYDCQLSKYRITNSLIKDKIQNLLSSEELQNINYQIYKNITSKCDNGSLEKTYYMLKCRDFIKNNENKFEIKNFILKSAEIYKDNKEFMMASDCYKFVLNIMYNGILDENSINMYIEIIKMEFYSRKFSRTNDYLLLVNNFFNNSLKHTASVLTILNFTRKRDFSKVADMIQKIFGKELFMEDNTVADIFNERLLAGFVRLPECNKSEIIDRIEVLTAALYIFAGNDESLFYNSLKNIVYLSLFHGVTKYSFFAFYIYSIYLGYQLNNNINEAGVEKIAVIQNELLTRYNNDLKSEKKIIDSYINNPDYNYYNNFHLIIHYILNMIFKPGFTTGYAIELCTNVSSNINSDVDTFEQIEILQTFLLKLSGLKNETNIKYSGSFSYFLDLVHHYFTDELIFEKFSLNQLNKEWDNCIENLLFKKEFNFFRILVLCKIFNGANNIEKKYIYNEIKDIAEWFNTKIDTRIDMKLNIMKIIIDSELARIDNNYYDAILLYEKAMDLSYKSESILFEAISNNLAGLFYQKIGKPILAGEYHNKSAVLFYRMGISTKISSNNDFRIITEKQSEVKMKKAFSSMQIKGITNHEYRVIKLIEEGKSNKDIGLHLFIAEPTVKKHITNIFKKLNIKNRYELISLMKQLPDS